MATSSKSLSNMAANQAPLHKMAATPEPPAVIDVKPQSSAIMDATPVFLSIMNVAFEDTKVFQRWLRLLSSVADPPMDPPAVRAAGIPRTSALVVTKTVLLVHSRPRVLSSSSSPTPAFEMVASVAEPPEVVASALAPLMAVETICEISDCPVTANSPPVLFTVKEAVCELSACLVMAVETVVNLPVLSVPILPDLPWLSSAQPAPPLCSSAPP
ncbi:hypothetical protein H4Q32_021494 [Labeo rohita]|uniref:Uncharacterized protein n=1 Tax=Labeo rohita TaxID=84645 RepID=A0ABQ8MR19_LABRO|nr:hypothetical protein H4Q32_021494 [Labeo rohita]